MLFVAAAAAAVAALAAGCGAGGGKSTSSAPKNTSTALPAADAVRLAANQTSQFKSVNAGINMRMSGQRAVAMQGTIAMRTQPSLGMEMNIPSITANGQNLPGGMREILLAKGIYLHAQQLTSMAGKPWVFIPASTINQKTGGAFSQLSQQVQQQDPLSSARMLGAAENVKRIGSGSVNGVPVTRYSGTIPVQRGLSRLNSQQRAQLQQMLSSMGISTVSFTAGVDQQHQIRQLTEQMNGTSERMLTTVTVTGLNQPVSIQAPPASQVGKLPASAPSSGSSSGGSAGTMG